MRIMEEAYSADILIIGAGTAGALCAVAAARLGLKTLLVERGGAVGGVGVNALMGSMANLAGNRGGEPFVGGLITELLDRMAEKGGIPYHSGEEAVNGRIGKPFSIPFQPIFYSIVLNDMITESGAKLWLNTTLIGGRERKDRTKIMRFIHDCRTIEVRAAVVVDATGNATAACMLGAEVYSLPSAQQGKAVVSYGSLIRLGQVDIQKTLDYIQASKPWREKEEYEIWLRNRLEDNWTKCRHLADPLHYDHAPMDTPEDVLFTEKKYAYIMKRWKEEGILYTLELSLFRDLIKKAEENGDFILLKKDKGESGITFNGDGIAYGGWGRGIALCNVAKPFGYDPGEADQDTRAAHQALHYNEMFYHFVKKYVPGFERCEWLEMGEQTVARGSRMIVGCDNTEGLDSNELFRQPIYLFGGMYPFRTGQPVPYGKIVSKNIINLFAVGKSSSHGLQYRSQMSCMSMGIAAAAAAKVIISTGYDSHGIPTGSLRSCLKELKVVLPNAGD